MTLIGSDQKIRQIGKIFKFENHEAERDEDEGLAWYTAEELIHFKPEDGLEIHEKGYMGVLMKQIGEGLKILEQAPKFRIEESWKIEKLMTGLRIQDQASFELVIRSIEGFLGTQTYLHRYQDILHQSSHFKPWFLSLFTQHLFHRSYPHLHHFTDSDFRQIQIYLRFNYPDLYHEILISLSQENGTDLDFIQASLDRLITSTQLQIIQERIIINRNQALNLKNIKSHQILKALTLDFQIQEEFLNPNLIHHSSTPDIHHLPLDVSLFKLQTHTTEMMMVILEDLLKTKHQELIHEISSTIDHLIKDFPYTWSTIKSKLIQTLGIQSFDLHLQKLHQSLNFYQTRSKLFNSLSIGLNPRSKPIELFDEFINFKSLSTDSNFQKLLNDFKIKFGNSNHNQALNSLYEGASSYLKRNYYLAFGLSLSSKTKDEEYYLKYNYISTRFAIQFLKIDQLANSIKFEFIHTLRNSIRSKIGEDEYNQKIQIIRHIASESNLSKLWNDHVLQSIKPIKHVPQIYQHRWILEAGRGLRFDESFPTFQHLPKLSIQIFNDALFNLRSQDWEHLINQLGKDKIESRIQRLQIKSSNHYLQRWEDLAEKVWLTHDLNFDQLIQFSEFLAVGESYPNQKSNLQRLYSFKSKLIKTLGSQSSLIPNSKTIKIWKGSREEDWMRDHLGTFSSNGKLIQVYDDRMKRLQHTVDVYELSVAHLIYLHHLRKPSSKSSKSKSLSSQFQWKPSFTRFQTDLV